MKKLLFIAILFLSGCSYHKDYHNIEVWNSNFNDMYSYKYDLNIKRENLLTKKREEIFNDEFITHSNFGMYYKNKRDNEAFEFEFQVNTDKISYPDIEYYIEFSNIKILNNNSYTINSVIDNDGDKVEYLESYKKIFYKKDINNKYMVIDKTINGVPYQYIITFKVKESWYKYISFLLPKNTEK